ncbi:helix-turn-helix domain-containing protein [Pseudarthrobacter sulfonivorans]|uniref:MarR family transcriptional regulator n=1 Tax=Pseudarthrobacter sulfonivorans TaxID=121292 RepID=UPI00286044AF|nr:helix-turn-helix domain-containing protein [Pseudarthrobacter sulfonivorans]MDR6416253.1 hypothetical protein [Pseudarthrobacter sulfonivorans]
MYVLTIDQRGSTTDVDRVPGLISALRSLTPAPFERSVGDELQGVVEHAADVVEIALHALRDGHWYVGIGIGTVLLAPGASPREGTGNGFVAARKAVELAKGAAAQVPLSVVPGSMGRGRDTPPDAGEGAMSSANAQAVLRLMGRVVQQRTPAQWRVVDRLRALQDGEGGHGSQKHVARQLGITEQSVSRAVLRSGWPEESAARPAAAMLLEYAHAQILEPSRSLALRTTPAQGTPTKGNR